MLKKGQRFLVTTRLPATALTHWLAPFTGGYKISIPVDTVVIIDHDQVHTAKGVSCIPEQYDALHEQFIPAEDRNAEKYSGYSLSVLVSELLSHSSPV